MQRRQPIAKITLGFVAAVALGNAAFAGPVLNKDISNSPRETIVRTPGNIEHHVFIRNDGNYGYVIHDYNNGTVQHFVINAQTGMILPGTLPSQK